MAIKTLTDLPGRTCCTSEGDVITKRKREMTMTGLLNQILKISIGIILQGKVWIIKSSPSKKGEYTLWDIIPLLILQKENKLQNPKVQGDCQLLKGVMFKAFLLQYAI